MRFHNESNKVAIELWVVQFWSEIILVISKSNERAKCTPLSSITIINFLFAFLVETAVSVTPPGQSFDILSVFLTTSFVTARKVSFVKPR